MRASAARSSRGSRTGTSPHSSRRRRASLATRRRPPKKASRPARLLKARLPRRVIALESCLDVIEGREDLGRKRRRLVPGDDAFQVLVDAINEFAVGLEAHAQRNVRPKVARRPQLIAAVPRGVWLREVVAAWAHFMLSLIHISEPTRL